MESVELGIPKRIGWALEFKRFSSYLCINWSWHGTLQNVMSHAKKGQKARFTKEGPNLTKPNQSIYFIK